MATKLNIGLIIILIMAFLGMLSLYFVFNPSEFTFFPKCPFYSMTNLYCPGCGSQRSIHDIINGDIVDGLKHNLLIVILGLVLTYDFGMTLMNRITNKIKFNVLHSSKTTYTILILVILFWVFRNIKVYPFTILAP